MTINAYATKAAGQHLEPFRYEPKELEPCDLEVRISHCGICHSDIHLIDDDWQISQYPLVPGHEIVGVITAKGAQVGNFDIGQRVGIGWQRGACLSCELCLSGYEHMCAQNQATCVGHFGGFAEMIRVDSRFAFDIPEPIDSEHAGPLLCGGITVYSPLRSLGITPPMKVGVIGIGGLGHMAVQFARAMGCEVTAFSSTPDKESEAMSFGAHHFIPSNERGALEKTANSLDFIINTVYADLDWIAYLNVLRPNGRICFVGAPANPITVPSFPLLMGQKGVVGSVIGSRARINEMLAFAGRHGITPMTEPVSMERCNEAVAKVRENKARYRMVLMN